VTAAVCDVLNETQVHDVMATAAGGGGVLDILVLAAGITGPIETPVTELSVDDFREVMDVNVTGTFLCCRAAVPFLRRAQAGGRIVTFSSTAGLRGYPNRVGYSHRSGPSAASHARWLGSSARWHHGQQRRAVHRARKPHGGCGRR